MNKNFRLNKMGNSTSTNSASELINVSIDVINSYVQKCSTYQSNAIDISLNNCPGLTINDIEQGFNGSINVNCMQSELTSSAITSDIAQAMTQAATAITQSLGGVSESDATNIADLAVKLGISIQNKYVSDCLQSYSNNFSLNCNNSPGVFIGKSDQSTTIKEISQCALKATTDNDIKQKLTQQLSQTAVAKEENSLSVGFLIIIVVIALILVVSSFLF